MEHHETLFLKTDTRHLIPETLITYLHITHKHIKSETIGYR